MDTFKRILVIRLSALGDVINTLPVLSELRRAFPIAEIAWAVEPGPAEIVKVQPLVSQTIIVNRKQWTKVFVEPWNWSSAIGEVRATVKALRVPVFDVALDFQGNLRSGFLMRVSGASRRIGYHHEDRQEPDLGFSTEQASPLGMPCHRTYKALHLLTVLGIAPGPPSASLPIPSRESERVEIFLGACGIKPGEYVAIHPGTSAFGSYKRWTDEGYIRLMERIVKDYGLSVILTWSGRERAYVNSLAAAVNSPNVIPAFETSLLELAALYRKARLFIAADTGPGHLAGLVGTPVVSIFGPKDPAVYRPYFSPCWVVQRDLWCRPCRLRRCSSPVCITGIPFQEIYDVVENALSSTESDSRAVQKS